ncbi:hypothetical protein MNBD_GAMMA07-2579 [hydrothermal vent metagenome]|uniref:Carrier domain-containing protein n=1 Tax=hydrothermal vent metagenome TaxID=652676 RepID=A0A3B0X5X3_9ZZZZ
MSQENKIREILSFIFDLDNDADFESLSIEANASWDSMKQVTIITALENEFDLFIESDDAVNLTSYTKILQYVERNI